MSDSTTRITKPNKATESSGARTARIGKTAGAANDLQRLEEQFPMEKVEKELVEFNDARYQIAAAKISCRPSELRQQLLGKEVFPEEPTADSRRNIRSASSYANPKYGWPSCGCSTLKIPILGALELLNSS